MTTYNTSIEILEEIRNRAAWASEEDAIDDGIEALKEKDRRSKDRLSFDDPIDSSED